ncbi:hypothetical protein HTZ97_16540 [Desulfuromonas acetoxidans]|uniref:hypothetical protein n=1 Tax=Desulfuromonas acetoxidans TaxID=891 RepID=UPI000053C703|nr:hypothetical protein [Desulfuromonas acetoxidans]MBF0647085.1 hypothetical protein [Desulfuromonas acetoxidans]NVD26202.1 hypothetical protein [Desulfuromonas acetoxidans]NVE18066.1 hypothetical protein [Desulfuromonas acetoxidans]
MTSQQHWSSAYIGQKFTPDMACYMWFRRIVFERFGRDLPLVNIPPDKDPAKVGVRMVTADMAREFGYASTTDPQEGDAVYLSRNGRSQHHIGMVVLVNGKRLILHAMEEIGVVLDDSTSLRQNGFTIMGYWTYENSSQ